MKKKKIIKVTNADGSVSHILEGAVVTSILYAERQEATRKREEYNWNAEEAVAEAVRRHRPWGMVVSKHKYGYNCLYNISKSCPASKVNRLGLNDLYGTPCWHDDYHQLSIEELKEIAGSDWKARNNLKHR